MIRKYMIKYLKITKLDQNKKNKYLIWILSSGSQFKNKRKQLNNQTNILRNTRLSLTMRLNRKSNCRWNYYKLQKDLRNYKRKKCKNLNSLKIRSKN